MKRIECHDVLELTLSAEALPANPFMDARLTTKFTGPDGKTVPADGFYYRDKTWMVRFVPGKTGPWKYAMQLDGAGKQDATSGTFECVPSKRHGFVRISKTNPYRFEHDDGTPFYPIGQQVGPGVPRQVGFDGADDGKWANTDRETFMKAFARATNLIRSQLGCGTKAGCALPVIADKDSLDRYDVDNCLLLDESCKVIKKYGWAQVLIPFQDMSLWGGNGTAFGSARDTREYKSLESKHLPAVERYLRYVVARWGAYVDIWELFNEDGYSPQDFLAHLASVVRDADPYRHPIMTNYEWPRAEWCEILSVHEYMGIPAERVPGHLSKEFARLKSFGKPVLYTEFGNQKSFGNVDPVKWRVAMWTAFMNEAALTFWNMSGRRVPPTSATGGGNPNAYLGPDTRRHLQILNDFCETLPLTMRPVLGLTDHQEIEFWALGNEETTILYLHNPQDHTKTVTAGDIAVGTGKGSFSVKWMDPEAGKTVKEETRASQGNMLWLKVPPFAVDLSARIDRQAKGGH